MSDEIFPQYTKEEVEVEVASPKMNDPVWDSILKKVILRETAVSIISNGVLKRFISAKEIGATDIFVEKAQDILETRSSDMSKYAQWSAAAASMLVLIFFVAIFCMEIFHITIEAKFATQSLIAGIVKNATIAGVFLGIEYVLVSLYRAYTHEATILKNRIHSLRLGKLFIYLKYSSVDDKKY